MKITQFLTGVASAALLAGAANAYTLKAADVDGIVAGIEDTSTILASELDFSGLSGQLEFFIEQTSDFVFTTDDVLLTLTLTNATFNTAFTIADVDAACASGASIVSGGGVGASEVVLLVSGLDGCDNSNGDANFDTAAEFGFFPDVSPTGAGSVSVSTNIETDSGGTPVDGGEASNAPFTMITLQDAFSVTFTPDLTDPVADLDVNPIYTEFDAVGSPEDLGDIEVVCDTGVDVDFAGTAVDCTDATQLAGADLEIVGDFTGLTGGVVIGATPLVLAIGEQSGTLDIEPQADDNATGSGALAVAVTADGADAMQRSNYQATVTLDLGPAFIDEDPFTGALSDITREGTQVIFPWFASQTLVNAGAARNVARLSNLSDDDARVFVEILASSNPAFVGAGPVQVADLPAGGELGLRSNEVEAAIGSDFARGDLEVTIEATPENVTAKRLVQDADGRLSELNPGNVEQDQN